MSLQSVIEGIEMISLINMWGQFSTMMERFCMEFGLAVHPLRRLIHIKGTGGLSIPYKVYGSLSIPDLSCYNEDVLLLGIPKNNYGERVQIWLLVIDHPLSTVILEELQQVGDTWKQVHLSIVL